MECGMERRFHRGFTAAEKTNLGPLETRGVVEGDRASFQGEPLSSIYFLVAPWRGSSRGAAPLQVGIDACAR